jgi:hypothetical protein
MRFWPISTKGFILYTSLLFFTFCIQFVVGVSVVAIHIRSENLMMARMEKFSLFETAMIDRIYHAIQAMDYGDFASEYEGFLITVTYEEQSALLAFSGSTNVKMKLEFDDLVPCFKDYYALDE